MKGKSVTTVVVRTRAARSRQERLHHKERRHLPLAGRGARAATTQTPWLPRKTRWELQRWVQDWRA